MTKANSGNIGRREDLVTLVSDMRGMAIRELRRMYDDRERLFIHCLRRHTDGIRPEGISLRYTATVLLAIAQEPDLAGEVLPQEPPAALCTRLIERTAQTGDLGSVALTLWAARVLEHPAASKALDRLRSMNPATAACPTVELSWAITALSVAGNDATDASLRDALAERLLRSQNPSSGLFAHWPVGVAPSWWRSHVCCYADKVYPIQALSHYYAATRQTGAIEAAKRCAERMCRMQGGAGQWWWHHDIRTGRVVEGYPVYAVHQDAMGPMAIFALWKACGVLHRAAVEKCLEWLVRPPEVAQSLIDREADIIWRKVARHEPNKLARTLQAMASRLHPAARVPALDLLMPPTWIDFESRPYHMAWILYAFPADRCAQVGW